MSTTSETVIASLKLDSKIEARIQRLASFRQQTPDSFMREAIEQHVERQEKREQFLKDGVAAWKDYQETGLHLTGDEVESWIEKLESGEDTELPECHL